MFITYTSYDDFKCILSGHDLFEWSEIMSEQNDGLTFAENG